MGQIEVQNRLMHSPDWPCQPTMHGLCHGCGFGSAIGSTLSVAHSSPTFPRTYPQIVTPLQPICLFSSLQQGHNLLQAAKVAHFPSKWAENT
jgi:hypothetical protein